MGLATYFAVVAGEQGISAIALFLLGIFCFLMVRRRNDPLRTPFLYLKLAIPFYFVSMLALTLSYIASTIMVNSGGNGFITLFTISGRVGAIGTFVGLVGDVQLILCIVELSLSFFRVMGRPSGSGAQTIFRVVALAAAVLLLVLATACLGIHQANITAILESDIYESTGISTSTVNRLYGSWSVIHFLVALGLEALSLMVFSSSHKERQYTKLTRRLLVVTTLNNLRTTFDLYVATRYYLSGPRNQPYYLLILYPILYMWTTIVILSLLTDIGSRKHDGLWSNSNSMSGLRPSNGFNPNTTYGPWNGGNARPSALGWSGYQHPLPPAYGQYQQPGSYNPDQQPTQAEVHGSIVPVRRELAASPSQQYQETYMLQQPQPHLTGQQPPHSGAPQSAPVEAHGLPISPFGPVPGGLTAQQQQPLPGQPGVQHVYEVAGMREQKS